MLCGAKRQARAGHGLVLRDGAAWEGVLEGHEFGPAARGRVREADLAP